MGRILIVDDEQDIVDAYEMILSKAGFKTVKAFDGLDAVSKISNENFDLVITDIKMPKLTGVELIENLRKRELETQTKCPIILSSGFIDDFVYTKFSNIGRIYFMPKPVPPADLLAKVRSVLNIQTKKPMTDARILNTVLASIVKTLGEMTGLKVSQGQPQVKKEGDKSGDVSAITTILSSTFKGSVSLSFDEKSFLNLTSRFYKIEFQAINEENRDLIINILNKGIEDAKKEFNSNQIEIQAAVPSVVTGRDHSLDHKLHVPVILIPFSIEGSGSCKVEICSAVD